MRRIEIRRLDAPLGAAVEGIDPDAIGGLEPEMFETIEAALHRHRVLVFPGAPRENAQLVRFAERFGRLVTLYEHGTTVPGFPAIVRVSNICEEGRPIGLAGSQELPWHHDHSYLEHPARESFLEATELPIDSPQTAFVDMSAALASLPGRLRERLRGLRAVHHIDERRNDVEGDAEDASGRARATSVTPNYDDETNRLAQDRIAAHRALHPVVARHPVSGAETLYISPFATHSIVGLPSDESTTLLDELFDRAIRPESIYAHAWLPGDLVVWDTITCLHRRDAFDPSGRRLMKQMSTCCDAPLDAGA
jgi:alpha-ketoglutarate-dependent taurine dioxygenase